MNKKLLLYLILSIISLSLLGQSTVVTSYGTNAGTGGTYNAFFGGSAGRVTTGTGNSFIGNNAGYFNTTGTHNVFLGNASGWFNTSGSNNVNIGDGAAYYNSTGSSNTAIGNAALWFNTGSSNNTALGTGAGYNALGSGNVFLGFNAGSNETGSNKLYIANSGTSPLIYGNFSTGSVGIGTTSSDGFQINADVSETAQATSNIRMGVNAGAPRLIFDMAGSSPFQIDNSGGQLRIFNPGVVRMVVNGNGNVGIGTTSPAYKLDVSGSINASSILINGQPFAGGGSQWATSGASINYPGGNVGIGTISPDAKLAVKGQIHANEVKVDLLGSVAPDYVFEKSYALPTLEEVKTYIDQNKHLPEIPSAKEMEKNGVQLGEMNMLLLKKIEELTLYVIEQNKKLQNQQGEIEKLKRYIGKN